MIRRHPHTIAGHQVRRIGERHANQANQLLTRAGINGIYGTLHHVSEHRISSQQAIINRVRGEHGATIEAHVSRSKAASEAAREAAATRKADGIKPFGGHNWATESKAQRHANALKAAATRKARGEKSFAHISADAQRRAAEKAVATKRARGERLGGHRHR